MTNESKGVQRFLLFLGIILIFISFHILGCSTYSPLGKPVFQVTKSNGEMVWRKTAVTKLDGEKVNIVVESPDQQRIFNPGDSSLNHIPLNLAAMKVSSFGKWKTPDASLFVLESPVQYDASQNTYVLTDPVLSTLDGSDSIRLIANLPSGEQINVDVPNGESIKNHPHIALDGGVKQ